VRILLEVHGAGNIVVDPDKTNKCRLYKEKMLFLINMTNVERATFDFDGKDARIFRENFIFDMDTVTDLGKYLVVLRKTFIKGKNKHPKFLYIIEPVNKIFYFKR
jgi:hypothetical protein